MQNIKVKLYLATGQRDPPFVQISNVFIWPYLIMPSKGDTIDIYQDPFLVPDHEDFNDEIRNALDRGTVELIYKAFSTEKEDDENSADIIFYCKPF